MLMVGVMVLCSTLPSNAAELLDLEYTEEFIDSEAELSSVNDELQAPEFDEEYNALEDEPQNESDAVESQDLEIPSFIYIKKIVTGESQILTAEELASVIKEYEGKWLSIERLKMMLDGVNELYHQKGAITAKAFLPPQTVEDGVLRVELVEGRIGEIRVENNRFTSKRYIRNRLGLTKGEIFYLDQLETKLHLFNLANDIMVIAELAAGEEYQTTDVIIKTLEPPNFQATIFTDNLGSEDTGQYRAGFNLSVKSLFGFRDPITLSGVFSQGLISAMLNYRLPLHKTGFYFEAGYGYIWSKNIKAQFEAGDLGIGNEGDDLHLRFGKKSSTFDFEQDWFLIAQNQKNKSRLATSIISELDLITISGGFDRANRGNEMLRYYSHSLTGGKQDKRSLNEKNTDKFLKYNSQYQWQVNTPKNRRVTLSFTGQVGSEAIPEREQFAIGGLSTVRGFEAGIKRGDHGYCLRLEMHEQTPRWIKGFLFLDQGGAFRKWPLFKGDFIVSAGIGCNLQLTDRITGQVVCGVPYKEKVRIYFNAQASFY